MANKLNAQNPPLPTMALRLECPACGDSTTVAAERLIDGAGVCCEHCGMEAVLQREQLGHSGRVRWELIEAGDDDEP